MRWKQIGQWWLLVLALLLGGLLGSLPGQAASNTPASGFILTPLLPKDQLDKQAGYFNMKVTPGTTSTFRVSVSNYVAGNTGQRNDLRCRQRRVRAV
ncbi:cell surface protein precursor [Lactiplantibacillus plantarum]|nr:cell surface protein precursor [Lactiplantibacillus plantarum]MCG0756331.1 cell surface protein precursor [Lactiplantibacillus plantarum]MCG0773957.1 cell surface protein precursor [Lactiplantibacillus plantarum]MCG0842463.1 cell surface protein precursor [Lactiplantibacillus plantarum]MCG0868126.1 cell surface protein precursor [Lactiplantibacillus plantarum]